MKKLAFVACLLVPLSLYLYGKLSPYYAEYTAAKQVSSIVRQIPLNGVKPLDNSALKDAFKKITPPSTMPSAPHVVKPEPSRWHLPFTKAKPLPLPLPLVKPKITLVPVKPVAPPLELEPVEQQPIEFCALSWLSVHCGFAPQ